MAKRPLFFPRSDNYRLVEEKLFEFDWNPGFAPTQKKKNIAALHTAAANKGYEHVLEISTKSDEPLGVRLSAFNLKIELSSGESIFLECAYQGSKIFRNGGPYTDLFWKNPREAKKDERLSSSGALIGFRFDGQEWGLEPKTAFYDWLYLYALKNHAGYLKRLLSYDAFSDIEFNPQKSLNCQARSCAILVSLLRKGLYPEAALDKDLFISILRPDSLVQPHSKDHVQGSLF